MTVHTDTPARGEIKRGDRVTWKSRGKTYTGTVEVRVAYAEWRILTDDGRRLFADQKELTHVKQTS